MAKITSLRAWEVKDSRGEPTILVELESGQARATATVPSGASVGVHEALELRDGDSAVEKGRGVGKAIAQINEMIAAAVTEKEFDQKELDTFLCELDGTPNKRVLGANAILGISIAFARSEATRRAMPLYVYLGSLDGRNTFTMPQPLFNVLNGGKHARHGIDIQESMLAPIGFSSIRERVQAAKACDAALQSLLEKQGYELVRGDEGGFAPSLTSNDEALTLLVSAIEGAGYTTEQIRIALDIAASSFFKDGKYVLRSGGERVIGEEEMLAWYATIARTYPVISIEDGFAEDDMGGFAALTKELGDTISIVGDDLTVTNTKRILMAKEKKAVNACIIKPNQIGTVIETIAAVRTARAAGWKIFASHRSGETMDTFIADFAVGLSCEYLKAGAPTRPERMAKYDRLIEIEESLLAV